MITEILLIVIPALIASFVIGFFFGLAVERNRQTEESDWDLPPLDEPLPFRICDNHAGRQLIVKGGSND